MTYIGRFAPTPTGPLHFGSLVAALASYLDAKANNGQWLLRIEDLDPPREDPSASQLIQQQLIAHGLLWDGAIQFQSEHGQRYEEVLALLSLKDRVFPCHCSRKNLAMQNGLHHGKCDCLPSQPHALRLLVSDTQESFKDGVYGHYQQHMNEVGDQVLKRKDGLYAYQLAVLVDDYDSGITHVVRGVDLLDNTPRQIHLLSQLDWPIPKYMHIPLVTNLQGQKLSKQNQATAINTKTPIINLLEALKFLHQPLPPKALTNDLPTLLTWAANHWLPDQIPNSTLGLID